MLLQSRAVCGISELEFSVAPFCVAAFDRLSSSPRSPSLACSYESSELLHVKFALLYLMIS